MKFSQKVYDTFDIAKNTGCETMTVQDATFWYNKHHKEKKTKRQIRKNLHNLVRISDKILHIGNNEYKLKERLDDNISG